MASARVLLGPVAFRLVADNAVQKGNALLVAQLAGIQAAKQTAHLIPLCHPLPLTWVGVELELNVADESVKIQAEARTVGGTGVEMEARPIFLKTCQGSKH